MRVCKVRRPLAVIIPDKLTGSSYVIRAPRGRETIAVSPLASIVTRSPRGPPIPVKAGCSIDNTHSTHALLELQMWFYCLLYYTVVTEIARRDSAFSLVDVGNITQTLTEEMSRLSRTMRYFFFLVSYVFCIDVWWKQLRHKHRYNLSSAFKLSVGHVIKW